MKQNLYFSEFEWYSEKDRMWYGDLSTAGESECMLNGREARKYFLEGCRDQAECLRENGADYPELWVLYKQPAVLEDSECRGSTDMIDYDYDRDDVEEILRVLLYPAGMDLSRFERFDRYIAY